MEKAQKREGISHISGLYYGSIINVGVRHEPGPKLFKKVEHRKKIL